MQIRQLRADEGLAYRDIRLRALREAPHAFAATLEEEAAQPASFWLDLIARTAEAMEAALFVAERDDRTLGGTAFVRVSPEPPHGGYVGAMWVDEDLRGSGAADALLEAAERFALALGSSEVTLWVSDANPIARRFYERNGYVATSVAERQTSGITALMMLKPIDPYR
jgi:GNAT superfamily N-acetyltransferase